MKTIFPFFAAAITLILYLLFGGLRTEAQRPLRLSVNVWAGYEHLFLAEKLGFYEEEGLDIRLVETTSLEDSRLAYERGKVDGMASSVIEVLHAAGNTGTAPVIVLLPDYSDGGDVIVTRKSISSIHELKDARIGIERDTLAEYVAQRALAIAGYTQDDVVFVPLTQEEAVDAYDSGRVDAVVTYPPVSQQLLALDDTHAVFDSSNIPGEILDCVSFHPSAVRERPEDMRKLARVWQRTVDYARKHPDESRRLGALRQGISMEEFSDSLSGVRLMPVQQQHRFMQPGAELTTSLTHLKTMLFGQAGSDALPKNHAFIYQNATYSAH